MQNRAVITAATLALAGDSPPSQADLAGDASLEPFRVERFQDDKSVGPRPTERSRHTPLSLRLARETRRLLNAAGLSDDAVKGPATGLVSGSRYGCSMVYDLNRRLRDRGPRGIDAVCFAQATHNYPISVAAIELGLNGPCAALVGSPVAGMEALVCAVDWLRDGRCDRVIVAAYEDLDGVATEHLRRQTSEVGAFQEAMALLFIETGSAAERRGAPILAELRGVTILPRDAGAQDVSAMASRAFDSGKQEILHSIAGLGGRASSCLGASGLAEIALRVAYERENRERNWMIGAFDPSAGGAVAAVSVSPAEREIAA